MHGCVYYEECEYGGDPKKCAIGIEVYDDLAKKLELEYGGEGVQAIMHVIPHRLRRMGESFLIDIQSLHDNEENWTLKGLSKTGKKKVAAIKERHKLK